MKEEWRDVVGYEGQYEVSNMGIVRSVTRMVGNQWKKSTRLWTSRIMSVNVQRDGYCMVKLCRHSVCKYVTLHKIVMNAFAGPPPKGKEINHKDGNKANNCFDNLEYCTRSENLIHAYRVIGAHRAHGEQMANAVLTDKIVAKMRKLYATGKYTYDDIAAMFGVREGVVNGAVSRRTWKHVP